MIDPDYAYIQGWKCGLEGPNKTNSNIEIFLNSKNTEQWELGKNAAEQFKKFFNILPPRPEEGFLRVAPKQKEMQINFCKCDNSSPWLSGGQPNIVNGLLCCVKCGNPIECDFSDLDDGPHPAEAVNIDYRVCSKHWSIASDNIASREES